MAQLRMLYSPALKPLPELVEPAGFELRPLRKEELREWGMKLHPACGFSPKDDAYFEIYLPRVIPGGIMVCAEKSTGRIAASAAAQFSEAEVPGGLGWVMALPEMRGRGLGAAVTAAAMAFGVKHGLKIMCLLTDDSRLPAINLYLKFGWRPWLCAEDMPERWRKVLSELKIAPGTVENYRPDEAHDITVCHEL